MRRLGTILSVIIVFFVAFRNSKSFVRHSPSSCQESIQKPSVEKAVVKQESEPTPFVEEANTGIVVKEIDFPQESGLQQDDDSSDTDWNHQNGSEEEFLMNLDWTGNF